MIRLTFVTVVEPSFDVKVNVLFPGTTSETGITKLNDSKWKGLINGWATAVWPLTLTEIDVPENE